jgi:hypothetical protein
LAHPHTGLDADHGLYLPVIVDDPRESGGYDAEWIVTLGDWTDGIGETPRQLYDNLHGEHMTGMGAASRQPRHLDDALPQHVSPRGRDDDQPRLHILSFAIGHGPGITDPSLPRQSDLVSAGRDDTLGDECRPNYGTRGVRYAPPER